MYVEHLCLILEYEILSAYLYVLRTGASYIEKHNRIEIVLFNTKGNMDQFHF